MTYVPPHSEDAERATIGAVFMEPDLVLDIASTYNVDSSHFYIPALAIIWDTIRHLHKHGNPIGLLPVSQALKDSGKLDVVGGQPALESLVDSCQTAAHAEYYIKILHEKYMARTCADICRSAPVIFASSSSPEIAASQIALDLIKLSDRVSRKTKDEIKKEQLTAWARAMKGGTSGIPTPWNNINARFQGLQNGAVTLLAGRGGRGKSAVMATWGHFLGGMGYKVGWLPLEDGCRRTWARVAGIEGDFSTFELDIGKSTPEQLELAQKSFDRVQDWPIFMEDQPMTVDQICAWATTQKAKNKIDVLFIDAFKDIMREDHDVLGDNACSQQIVALAKRLDIPILVNNHVRKSGLEKGQQTGLLSEQDIRGSGRISDDARQVVILQNYVEGGFEKYSFHIIKNNYGPTGSYPLIRISNRSKWIEPPIMLKAPVAVHLPYRDDE